MEEEAHSVDARTALPALIARDAEQFGPTPLYQRFVEVLVAQGPTYRDARSTKRVGPARVTAAAEELGFRFLGGMTLLAFVPLLRLRRDLWVDPGHRAHERSA